MDAKESIESGKKIAYHCRSAATTAVRPINLRRRFLRSSRNFAFLLDRHSNVHGTSSAGSSATSKDIPSSSTYRESNHTDPTYTRGTFFGHFRFGVESSNSSVVKTLTEDGSIEMKNTREHKKLRYGG